MDRFVRLQVFDAEGKKVWRTFNLHYVRHFDEESNRMLLNGSRTAVLVEQDSMAKLIEVATTDIGAMSARMQYLQAKADSKTIPVNATLVLNDNMQNGLSDAIRYLADSLSRPWWKRFLGIR